MKNKIIIDLHKVRHHNVTQVLNREISRYIQLPNSATIITGRSLEMQRLSIKALKEMGFCEEDMYVYPHKIEITW